MISFTTVLNPSIGWHRARLKQMARFVLCSLPLTTPDLRLREVDAEDLAEGGLDRVRRAPHLYVKRDLAPANPLQAAEPLPPPNPSRSIGSCISGSPTVSHQIQMTTLGSRSFVEMFR